MDNLTLKDIADLGLSGFALVGVYVLWKRLTELTDRLFAYLEEARRERHQMRNQMQNLQTSTEVLAEKTKNGT